LTDNNSQSSSVYLSLLLARAVTAEIQQRMNDEHNKLSWSVELKQLCENSKQEAKRDMENMANRDTSPTRAPTPSRKKQKSRGNRRGKKTKKDSDSSGSTNESQNRVRVEKPRKTPPKDRGLNDKSTQRV